MDEKQTITPYPGSDTALMGGEIRRLRLSMGGFRIAKKRHGVSISLADLSNPSFETLAMLVWIALLPDLPDLDETVAMQWLSNVNEAEICGKVLSQLNELGDSLERFLPGAGEKKPEPAAVPTSSTSMS